MEIQALLSQNDGASSFAEKLLKQFGDGIKEEPNTDETTSPKNMLADSTTNSVLMTDTIKCEVTSTSAKGNGKRLHKSDLKSEPVVKIEKLCKPNKTFSIAMDSKQITEAVK